MFILALLDEIKYVVLFLLIGIVINFAIFKNLKVFIVFEEYEPIKLERIFFKMPVFTPTTKSLYKYDHLIPKD